VLSLAVNLGGLSVFVKKEEGIKYNKNSYNVSNRRLNHNNDEPNDERNL